MLGRRAYQPVRSVGVWIQKLEIAGLLLVPMLVVLVLGQLHLLAIVMWLTMAGLRFSRLSCISGGHSNDGIYVRW